MMLWQIVTETHHIALENLSDGNQDQLSLWKFTEPSYIFACSGKRLPLKDLDIFTPAYD